MAGDSLERGVLLFNEGRYEAALECFRHTSLRQSPETRFYRGHCLQAMGLGEQALREFAASPSHLPSRLGLAGVLRSQGKEKLAEAILRRVLNRSPDCAEGRRALEELLRSRAMEQRRVDDLRAAQGSWAEILRLNPGNAEAKKESEAVSAILARRSQTALVERETRLREKLIAKARGLRAAGLLDKAEKAWLRVLKIVPDNAEARPELLEIERLRSRRCLEGRRWSLAVKYALRVPPGDVTEVLAGIKGDGGLGVAEKLKALRAVYSGLKGKPGLELVLSVDLPELLIHWARELHQSGRWRQAESLLKGAPLSMRKSSLPIRLALAEARLQQGKPAGLKDSSDLDCLDQFRSLMLQARYKEAFRQAEAVIDQKRGSGQALNFLLWPWGNVVSTIGGARKVLERDLEKLRRAAGPWANLYRGILLRMFGSDQDAKALEPLLRFPAGRYGWMFCELGRARMRGRDFAGAVEAFGAALKSTAFVDWKTYAYRGEAFLLSGDFKKALRQFKLARENAPEDAEGDALAWEGEFHLWRGNHGRALKCLDQAAALGARYAFAWRGMAKIGLGAWREALPDLDRAIELKPWDFEALLWRGEARRRKGDYREALKDLDGAVEILPNLWSLANRALTRLALKDLPGMRSDFNRIPRERIEPVCGRLGLREASSFSDKEAARIMTELLKSEHFNCRVS